MTLANTPETPEKGVADRGIATTKKSLQLPIGRQRAEFLRSCRARIQPGDLGLPSPQRKRTEGLRREDVAALSGVSVAWYTWLEQGREMRVSDEVLERICHTFRLSEDERVYLFSLVQSRPPTLQQTTGQEAPAEILRMMEGLSIPAVLMNLRWDVIAWNRISVVYRDYGAMAPEDRNVLDVLFLRSPNEADPELETTARRVLAKVRVDYSKSRLDRTFDALIRRLEMQSPLFRRLWRTPEINVKSLGATRIRHPVYGELAFENTSYSPEGHPSLRLVLCAPNDGHTVKVLAHVNAQLAAAG